MLIKNIFKEIIHYNIIKIMYEIDQYNLNDDDGSDSKSLPSNIVKNLQLRVKTKRFYSIKKIMKCEWIDGKYYDTVTINMHGSGLTGSFIKNAVTGQVTKHRVGSSAENLYFSVAMCNGMDPKNGPVRLYYDSPSQYEKHQYELLDQETIDKWFERFQTIQDDFK